MTRLQHAHLQEVGRLIPRVHLLCCCGTLLNAAITQLTLSYVVLISLRAGCL